MCGKSELKIAREFSRRTTCKKMAETAEENESRLEIEKKNKIFVFFNKREFYRILHENDEMLTFFCHSSISFNFSEFFG